MYSQYFCDAFLSWLALFLLVTIINQCESAEMTFELPDQERMCFHEVVDKGVACVLEYQVIEGGNYDVDLYLSNPGGNILYSEQKKQYDRFEWTTDEKGEYKFCFSNEFSTFTHKTVYFDFIIGNEDLERLGTMGPLTAMTQMETSALTAYQSLKVVIDYQTHHRLRESQGRAFAEDVNESVQYWSIGQTVFILISGIGQVFLLRSFFKEKRPTHSSSSLST